MKGLFSAPRRLERLERLVSEREFDTGAEQLKARDHIDRTRGAITLDKLARAQPAVFHVDVMDMFNARLAFPAHYGEGHPDAGHTDPHSPDTIRIMRAIVSRTDEQMGAEMAAGFEFKLSPNSPFEYQGGSFYFESELLVGGAQSEGES